MNKKRTAGMGMFSDEKYTCQYPWPDNCAVQCGGNGIVFTGRSMDEAFDDPLTTIGETLGVLAVPQDIGYRTAFFEAFPRKPNTFLRGEGKTVTEAETAAWEKYQRHTACKHPAFEKKNYTNGAGFCVKCDMFSPRHYAPWEQCLHCDYPVYPGSVCFHCDLFVEVANGSSNGHILGSMFEQYEHDQRMAAKWLIEQSYQCLDCGTSIGDMRFISSMDYRLTEEERSRSSCLRQVAVGTIGIQKTERIFPFSVFYECKCNKLKLIVDLVEQQ